MLDLLVPIGRCERRKLTLPLLPESMYDRLSSLDFLQFFIPFAFPRQFTNFPLRTICFGGGIMAKRDQP